MQGYSEKVREHFFNPRNAGALADANAVGEVGSLSGGDALRLMLRVNPDTDVIEAARFQTFGCGPAIAASSALTVLVIGKTIAEARRLTDRDIVDFLDGLPPEKMRFPARGRQALAAAVAAYSGEAAEATEPTDRADGAPICRCAGVAAGAVARTIRADALTTPDSVTLRTGAGGACGACREAQEEILADTNAAMVAEGLIAAADAWAFGAAPTPTPPAPPAPAPTAGARRPEPVRIAMPPARPAGPAAVRPAPHAESAPGVATVLTPEREAMLAARVFEELRPVFRRDGGDVELVELAGATARVRMSGACAGCMLASQTLGGLQRRLSEALGRSVRVVPVGKT